MMKPHGLQDGREAEIRRAIAEAATEARGGGRGLVHYSAAFDLLEALDTARAGFRAWQAKDAAQAANGTLRDKTTAEREGALRAALLDVLSVAGWDMAYTWVPSDVAPFVKRKLYEAATNKDAAELLSAAEWLDGQAEPTVIYTVDSRDGRAAGALWCPWSNANLRPAPSTHLAILAAARSLGWGGR